MVLKFHQSSGLSQRRGQALLDMLRHPEFCIKDVQSTTIVQLLRRLERPLKECAVSTYNLWKPGDGNQRLELVIRDYLEVFREIMLDPRWREQFDLAFRPSFDELGRRLIGPPCSALSWERIQTILGKDVAVGVAQLYFDGTFMGPSTGIESGYISSLNLRSAAKFQQESVKMFALIPTCTKMMMLQCPDPLKRGHQDTRNGGAPSLQRCDSPDAEHILQEGRGGGCSLSTWKCLLHARHHAMSSLGPRGDGTTLSQGSQRLSVMRMP